MANEPRGESESAVMLREMGVGNLHNETAMKHDESAR